MKHSQLLALIGLIFVVSITIINVLISSKDSLLALVHDESTPISIASSKQHFVLSDTKTNGKVTRNVHVLDGKETSLGNNGGVGSENISAGSEESESDGNATVRPIELRLPPKVIEWIQKRHTMYFDVYKTKEETSRRNKRWSRSVNDPDKYIYNETTGFGKYQDDKDGPWMDFIIAGHPKTGTTTLVANLGNAAPMMVKDFCAARPSTLLHYLLDVWPRKFPHVTEKTDKFIPDRNLQMAGFKCPKLVGDPELLFRYTLTHPRTKLIIGIRHPVSWFNSFLKMGNVGDPYGLMELCPYWANIDPLSGIPGGVPIEQAKRNLEREVCVGECRCNLPLCFPRSRLHLSLARIGKTPLSQAERDLLAPGDPDGGINLASAHARNPIFVYDQAQMKVDSYWDELADFLGLNYIPNHHYHGSKGMKINTTLCSPHYDEFRSMIMEHSYNMSVWLEDYLLPLGLDPDRPDVVIANTTSFREIIKTYRSDPCGKLVRNYVDGIFRLGGLDEEGKPAQMIIHSNHTKQCNPITYGDLDKKRERRRKMEKKRQEDADRAT